MALEFDLDFDELKTEGSWIYVERNMARSRNKKLRSHYQITARPWHQEKEK